MGDFLPGSDTIAASSTPPGQSGLAVVRLSGPDAIAVADRVFRSFSGHLPLSEQPGYRLVPGAVPDVDDVVCGLFRAPHSPTGEDVVEISCHGGRAVREAILERLLDAGARLAEPGEFSRRAFLNGKLDLSQAEAVIDLIGADASRQAEAAYRQLKGSLGREVRSLSDRLHALRARVELFLEFPDNEQTETAVDGLVADLSALAGALAELAETYRQGRLLARGLDVVLIGRPNAGKSSLLNALVGSDRAIVTATPGTTRDTIEVPLTLGGYLVTLTDTAGLTESDDPIEEEGVRRAERARDDADLILYLVAADEQADVIAAELRTAADLAAAGRTLILLRSKSDLPDRQTPAGGWPPASLSVSARTNDGIDDLKDRIVETIEAGIDPADVIVTNARHRDELRQAASGLREAVAEIAAGRSYDLVAVWLNDAASHLAAISGDDVTEALVDAIFANFCIGK